MIFMPAKSAKREKKNNCSIYPTDRKKIKSVVERSDVAEILRQDSADGVTQRKRKDVFGHVTLRGH